jgi:hypothetical protein
MSLPEWLQQELARIQAERDRLAEEDRQARRAAYDEWARNYAASTAAPPASSPATARTSSSRATAGTTRRPDDD